MVHYLNPVNHVPGVQIGCHHTQWVVCSYKLIKIIKKSSENKKSTAQVSNLGSLNLPLVSSPKHFMLQISCSDHKQSVMCHLFSIICCIQGFSGILSKIFSEYSTSSFYILVALWVAVEVILRGQHPNFFKEDSSF